MREKNGIVDIKTAENAQAYREQEWTESDLIEDIVSNVAEDILPRRVCHSRN